MKLKIRSLQNKTIPVRYTSQGQNISPRLDWSGVPDGAQEFALICEDPDAPFPKPFVHWIIYGLSANTTMLPEGIPTQEEIEAPVFARQGKNSMQQVGYMGPNPPFFHGAHHYHFRLFALREPLPLLPGASREEFFKALEGKVIAEASFTALYEKTKLQKARAVAMWAGVAGGLGAMGWLLKRRVGRPSGATADVIR
jgi:Raf kinase inhibitor-like YbhB/YbcL family protein